MRYDRNPTPLKQSMEPPLVWAETPIGRHPAAMPEGVARDLPTLFCECPDARSETCRWETWLVRCRETQERYPESLYAKELVRLAESALAYRATIPVEQTFWRLGSTRPAR